MNVAYYVDVIEKDTGKVDEHMGPVYSVSEAETIKRGAEINLNRKDYRVAIHEERL